VPERLHDLVGSDQAPGDDLIVAEPTELLTPEVDAARGGVDRAHQAGKERRLSCAVRTEDAEDLLGPDLQRDPVERQEPAEALAHRGNGENGGALSCHRAPPRSPGSDAVAASTRGAPTGP